ncbi:MAG: tetratricopeptide repeat protein [Planctomycetes bacterium]|nr:tetratricopeptide repeat protein [Planctomycetota bacterium]
MNRSTIHATTGATLVFFGFGLLGAPAALAQQGGRGRDRPRPGQPETPAAASTIATLVLEDGRTREGVDVREEKFAAIKFRDRGRNDEIPGDRVVEIRYQAAPGAFTGGVSQYRGGAFDRAVQSFTACRNAAQDGTWVWFHATYWLGESQRQAGNAGEAVTELQRFLEKGADHWLAPAAIFALGKAQIDAGRHANAVTTFKRLDSGFGDSWGLRGKLGEADAQFAQNQFAQARAAYETAERSASRHPGIRRQAQVGIGKCYVADKRYDDAVRYFEGIISQSGGVDPEVGGGAWVGIGDCRFEQAKASNNDQNRLKEALIAYQTAVVRYAGVPGAYPRALFQSAQIYRLLNLPDLAKHQEDELRSRYPKSPLVRQLGGG